METIIKVHTGLTLQEVNGMLDIIAKSESIICQSSLIYSDMSISLERFMEQFKSNYKPREWYFAIRQHGTEAGENKVYVKERCDSLGSAHITIKIKYYGETDSYSMTIASNK